MGGIVVLRMICLCHDESVPSLFLESFQISYAWYESLPYVKKDVLFVTLNMDLLGVSRNKCATAFKIPHLAAKLSVNRVFLS